MVTKKKTRLLLNLIDDHSVQDSYNGDRSNYNKLVNPSFESIDEQTLENVKKRTLRQRSFKFHDKKKLPNSRNLGSYDGLNRNDCKISF